jgi:hypothetical protein
MSVIQIRIISVPKIVIVSIFIVWGSQHTHMTCAESNRDNLKALLGRHGLESIPEYYP